MRRNIKDGQWIKIRNEQEFKAEQTGRCNYGKYSGPMDYLELNYQERCPKNCCYDNVVELLSPSAVIYEVKEEMIELSSLLKEARRK